MNQNIDPTIVTPVCSPQEAASSLPNTATVYLSPLLVDGSLLLRCAPVSAVYEDSTATTDAAEVPVLIKQQNC